MLRWPALDELSVNVAVTTRHGGVSEGPYRSLNLALHVGDDPAAVADNRRRAATALGAAMDDLVFATQVHGNKAVVVSAADRGRGVAVPTDAVPECDALVTADPGPVLVILVADCVPIVLLDPSAGVLAAVHAGWRGTAARTLEAALEAMRHLGAEPRRIVAGIGPAASPRTYEVGSEVAAALGEGLGPVASDVLTPLPAPPGEPTPPAESAPPAAGRRSWLVGLAEANRRILVEAGVRADAVHVAPQTTGGGGPFFSDRQARPCGRFGLLARLRP